MLRHVVFSVSGPSSSTDARKNNYENSGIGAPKHDISIIVFLPPSLLFFVGTFLHLTGYKLGGINTYVFFV